MTIEINEGEGRCCNDKVISYKQLNEIKKLMLNIYEEEDDDFPDYRKIEIWERAIDRRLKDYAKDVQLEVWQLIKWHNDDCASTLKEHGWKVVSYKENFRKGN